MRNKRLTFVYFTVYVMLSMVLQGMMVESPAPAGLMRRAGDANKAEEPQASQNDITGYIVKC